MSSAFLYSRIAAAGSPSAARRSARSRWPAKRSSSVEQAASRSTSGGRAERARRDTPRLLVEPGELALRVRRLGEIPRLDGGLEHLPRPLLVARLREGDAQPIADRRRLRARLRRL